MIAAVQDDSEEWVTTKKVEIVTTKNIERKVERKVVLEDGRVMEEEIPVVTVDTTEDKKVYQTDQDEERRLLREMRGGECDDKVTSVKNIKDIKENLIKTEAVQSIGNIARKDLTRVIKNKGDIRKYLRRREDEDQKSQVSKAPHTVFSSRNHRVVTDKEDVRERQWVKNGKMQNERVKTEEHIEYDSGDDPDDEGSSSSEKSSHHKYKPETYKTRKDERMTEYYRTKVDNNNKLHRVKVGHGPHYVSESKEVVREDDNQLNRRSFYPRRTQMPQHLLAGVDAVAGLNQRNKRTMSHTDSWLEKHFGSTSSLSVSSVDTSRSGSVEGYALRRSASICDIRPVSRYSNVYYATVRQTGQIPEVKMREKSDNKRYYAANRVSAHFSSSGQPIRPPRKNKRPTSSLYSDCQNQYLEYERPDNVNTRGHYYYGSQQTIHPALSRSTSLVQIPTQDRSNRDSGYYGAWPDRRRKGDLDKDRRHPDHDHSRANNKDHQARKSRQGNNMQGRSERAWTERKKGEDMKTRNPLTKKTSIEDHKTWKDSQNNVQSSAVQTTRHRVQYQGREQEDQAVYSTPHRIIYSRDHPVGSLSTKYRTRIVINSDEL